VLKELFVDSYEDEDLFPPMDSVLSTPVKKLQSHYKSANHDPCSTLTQSALKSKDTRKDKLNFDAAFQSNDVTSDETVLNDMDVLPKPVKQFHFLRLLTMIFVLPQFSQLLNQETTVKSS